jgi:hypothetical protein
MKNNRKKRYPAVDEHQQNNYPTYSQYNDTHPEETCKEDRYVLHLITKILFFILFFPVADIFVMVTVKVLRTESLNKNIIPLDILYLYTFQIMLF